MYLPCITARLKKEQEYINENPVSVIIIITTLESGN